MPYKSTGEMHPHRRRKKRPNYGIRTVEVDRGVNGFGFTISGQQPCILSCIVTHSPADQAGLKAGDFLISVNGLSVSKVTHDAVVQLIGNSVGPIKMSIAEYYYSDSSDDEPSEHFVPRSKPRYPYRPKVHRSHKHSVSSVVASASSPSCDNVSKQTSQVKASVDKRVLRHHANPHVHVEAHTPPKQMHSAYDTKKLPTVRMERAKLACTGYKALVGYLGTIEMPNQLQPSTRTHTVYSCIRRFRQEKRSPTTVVMMVLPTCVTLTNAENITLAIYPANRVVYINSSSEKESCYFGLVTTTIIENKYSDDYSMFTTDTYDINTTQRTSVKTNNRVWNCVDQVQTDKALLEARKVPDECEVEVSNSCHVFVTDAKLADHNIHTHKAVAFNIQCTQDVVTGGCLEFPKTSEYIVNLVQKMYSLPPSTPSATKPPMSVNPNEIPPCAKLPEALNLNDQLIAHSPQPSASSNSDSGIGFRDDCGLVSDRILVVDFPAQPPLPVIASSVHRPIAIDGSSIALDSLVQLSNFQASKSALQNLRARCSNPQCKSEIILSENIIYNNYENNRDSLVNSSVVHDEYSEYRTNFYPSDNPLDTNKNEDIQHASSTPKFSNGMEVNGNAYSEQRSMEMDTTVILGRSKSSDNVSDSVPLFKTPLCDKRFRSGKQAAKAAETEVARRASPKANFSHEELSIFTSGPQLVGDKSVSYSSLQEFCSLPTKGLQLSAVSEPDVRMKGYTDDDCGSFCSETIGANVTLEDASRNEYGSASNWASAFEKLLDDTKGRETFTEFLKKEFSAENIHFWTSCESYRKMDSMAERAREAELIYDRHLCKGASEPVNVDSQARNINVEALRQADPQLFVQAQKQIFNLMKFDSYPRFLKSDLYSECLSNVDVMLSSDGKDMRGSVSKGSSSKLKKSLSNAEDRRRKSLLPWHRKNRSKSKDRGEMEYCQQTQPTPAAQMSTPVPMKHLEENEKEMYSSRSSLTSWDIAINFSPDETRSLGENQTSCMQKNNFCRVILSDGATTVVQLRAEETVRGMANRLLDKRGLAYSNYEVFVAHKSKPIDLNKSSIDLAGQEVIIEHRVVFKLDLPNRKIISVKSKPVKILTDVLRPILHKYGYKLELVRVLESAQSEHCMNVNVPVTAVDGYRLSIQLGVDTEILTQEIIQAPKKMPTAPSLDEITNKVFEELLQGKSEVNRLPQMSDQGSLKSEDWGSEHSSGIFGRLLRRDSATNEKRNKKSLSNTRSKASSAHGSIEDFGSDSSSKKPLIAKWKAGVKLHVANKCSESDELYEGLKRAQRSRLEDQRGTEINFELPDFLKDKENAQQGVKKFRKQRKIPETAEHASLYEHSENGGIHRTANIPICNGKNDANEIAVKCRTTTFQSPSKYSTADNSPSKSSTCSNVSSRTGGYSSLDSTIIENVTVKHVDGPVGSSNTVSTHAHDFNEPPPLPPKPKVLPIKPSNWKKFPPVSTKQNDARGKHPLFLEQATSSFV